MKIDDIKDIKIKYRDKLIINPNATIGMEIEFKNVNLDWFQKLLEEKKLYDWRVKFDRSVTTIYKLKESNYEIYHGGEVNSPIIKNTEKNWNELKMVCDILKHEDARITEECGGHIHIGKQLLKKESYFNFFKLWFMYEPIIFRFSYGEFNKGRSDINYYAASIRELLKPYIINEKKFNIDEVITDLGSNRHLAVNFQNIITERSNTIEFRCPNGSIDPIIWQNNANFFVNLVDKANNVEIDKHKLKYLLNLYKTNYDEINMEDANELANIIFDNEIDKLYFLRQYVKDGNNEKPKAFAKSMKFTN